MFRTVCSQLRELSLEVSNFRMPFYAVRRGKTPGIYSTWDECSRHVKGFSGARYKKFATKEEATSFINGKDEARGPKFTHKNSPNGLKRKGSWNSQSSGSSYGSSGSTSNGASYFQSVKRFKHSDSGSSQSSNRKSVSVYTDGCCHANGKKMPKAGIGVYWGPNDERNVSERLLGRQTNNRAEIHAAIKAIKQAKEQQAEEITVHTDSQFMINSMTKWLEKWKRNGWKIADGTTVKNKDDFMELENTMGGIHVTWVHVRGHQGIEGNEAADRLANMGAKKPYIPVRSNTDDEDEEDLAFLIDHLTE